MSNIKADNFTWKTGESTAQLGTTVTGSQLVRGLVRAYVYFNASSGSPVTLGSYNVSSITRSSAGNFSINLSSAVSATNTTVPVGSHHASGVSWCPSPSINATTVTSIALVTANMSSAGQDAAINNVIVTGI